MSETNDRGRVDGAALDVLFREARTHGAWLPKPVPESLLREVYDLARLGPTSANASPARFVFVTTPEAKERLIPALMPGNVDKTKAAPVTVIVAQDMEFYEQLPKLFPFVDAKSWFVGNDAMIAHTAAQSSTLQGAYLMLAARALGLDCGPMAGFDGAKVNAEFFPDGKWKVNFLCNLGYGDHTKLPPRAPRLTFEEACRVL
ncbi:malonic semialdehyde reductase [Aquisphaera insulae]|uniref:malonic semialdehyde reductase n=1 Tax=Aquisphaera insulae TaxID=2712864 RepID=UPI0013EC218E|nr:malonic semialdehyde reductase [Aquisphaera insulae]